MVGDTSTNPADAEIESGNGRVARHAGAINPGETQRNAQGMPWNKSPHTGVGLSRGGCEEGTHVLGNDFRATVRVPENY